jgi:uncharacterized protein YdhG (YjbR/CyaY superfamily)
VAKTDFKSVAEYIASRPAPVRRVLRRVRTAIRRALPKADETISYQIPAYRLDGRTVIYFAGWKAHYSIYPATKRLAAAFKRELAPYEVNARGTIRFPLSEPIPVKLIEDLASFRATEVAADLTRRDHQQGRSNPR